LLQKKVSLLELKTSELNNELKEKELSCEQLAERAQAAQVSINLSLFCSVKKCWIDDVIFSFLLA
jgi:hypothetical protein